MTGPRSYPEAVAGPFPKPPLSFEDGEGRAIDLRRYDGGDDEREALVAMYDAFDPADRAQGIPPSREDRIRTWLADVLAADCRNVFAWHGDGVAGHATLVPDGEGFELAIFVGQRYQGAGIGTRLLRALLGDAEAAGVGKVWLTVERWNRAAVSLYQSIGFETVDAESFELEMALRLAPDEHGDVDPGIERDGGE